MQSTMTFLIFLSILLFSPNNIKCQARDTITANDPLFDDGRTVVSAGKIFELGFFSPGGNSNRYVGIWYYQRAPRTCVWIANRDKALVSLSGIVAIDDEDGANLKVLDTDGKTYFSTDQSSATLNSSAKLLDSGNLVFIDHRTGIHLWQSFENPTDTFLPGMEMNGELNLTSWLTQDNPATGNYTFQQDPKNNGFYIIKKRLSKIQRSIYWRSGEPGMFFSKSEMTNQVAFFLTNFSTTDSNQSIYKPPVPVYKSTIKDFSNKRLLLNSSGLLQFYNWDDRNGWSVLWSQPHDACSVDNICGNFGSCSSENGLECKCLPGFEPRYPDNWEAGDFTSGCQTKSAPCSTTTETNTFLNLEQTVVIPCTIASPEIGSVAQLKLKHLTYSLIFNTHFSGSLRITSPV